MTRRDPQGSRRILFAVDSRRYCFAVLTDAPPLASALAFALAWTGELKLAGLPLSAAGLASLAVSEPARSPCALPLPEAWGSSVGRLGTEGAAGVFGEAGTFGGDATDEVIEPARSPAAFPLTVLPADEVVCCAEPATEPAALTLPAMPLVAAF